MTGPTRQRASLLVALALNLALPGPAALAQAPAPALAPFSAAGSGQPPASWRPVGLPPGKAPLAQMDVVALEGARVLRLRTEASYGTLVHAVAGWTPSAESTLRWRWRLEEPVAGADLRRKEGDDAALKVCVMYDMPLEKVPFVERSLLRLARSVSGELLPAATVCYVWDATLAAGTALPNAYSKRVRFLVLDGAADRAGAWRAQQRRIDADFLRLFGDESGVVPPVIAIAVGADSDNTGGRSLAYIADIGLTP